MEYNDIKPGELVKVLTKEEDTEEEFWAKVLENNGEYLFVTYLQDSDKVYKGACVHSFESKANRVDYENLTEHWPDTIDLADIEMSKIAPNMFVFDIEVDDDDDDSDIYDAEDEDGGDDDSDEDSGDEMVLPPPDATTVDQQWNAWQPRTNGQKRFKETIDSLEVYARHAADDHNIRVQNRRK